MTTKVLLIEPYYGGSHKQFLDGLTDHLPGRFTLMSLPARKWKMRMQLAAPWFVKRLRSSSAQDNHYDIVLFSSFIDVAVFKALIRDVPGWNPQCQFLTYFHENQFNYPGLLPKTSVHQFTAINFSSALVSDRVGFNSEFNRESFLKHCKNYVAKAADMELEELLDSLAQKSSVLYPGLDFSGIDQAPRLDASAPEPLVIWNHRWEHDKNPDPFFDVLYRLQDEGVGFRVALLGQQFRNRPRCFDDARQRLGDRIVEFGFIEEKAEYYRLLGQGSVVVSTANHEFYGISIIEAVRAGCVPVLPDRLSYPELFDSRYRYGDGELYHHLKSTLLPGTRLTRAQSFEMTTRFSWESLRDRYKRWFEMD